MSQKQTFQKQKRNVPYFASSTHIVQVGGGHMTNHWTNIDDDSNLNQTTQFKM